MKIPLKKKIKMQVQQLRATRQKNSSQLGFRDYSDNSLVKMNELFDIKQKPMMMSFGRNQPAKLMNMGRAVS